MRKAVWSEISLALKELELELLRLGVWSVQGPARGQLASTEPFCVDTMAFEQWLQWVFIPRMQLHADQGLALPGGCRVTPMGEQALGHLGRGQMEVLRLLARIDQLTDDLG